MSGLVKAVEGYETAIAVVVVTTVVLALLLGGGGKKKSPVALDPKKEIDFELIEREDISPDTRR